MFYGVKLKVIRIANAGICGENLIELSLGMCGGTLGEIWVSGFRKPTAAELDDIWVCTDIDIKHTQVWVADVADALRAFTSVEAREHYRRYALAVALLENLSKAEWAETDGDVTIKPLVLLYEDI